MKQTFYFDGEQLKCFGKYIKKRVKLFVHRDSSDVNVSHYKTFLVAHNSLPNRIPDVGRTLVEQIEEIDRFIFE